MPASGTRLGPYEVSSLIGSGGMGEVYLARDTRLARNVAIKILPSHLSSRPELRERFEREARTVAALNHPHICSIFDVGSQDGVDYLVMEYLEGQTLAARLERGPLPLDEALKTAMEIVDALDKAHRQGVTHRDLKPGNIMLTKSGAKLLDFGLAKLRPATSAPAEFSERPTAEADSALTAEGAILGTLQYMAPEQLEGQEAGARTDIFAFGAVLYEMITGQRTFKGKSKASLIASILEHEPQPMSVLQPVAPPALERLVTMCLAKDPNDRWQTAHNVAAELKWIVDGTAAAKRAAGPAVAAASKWRHRLAWAFAAVLGATTLLLAGVLAYQYFTPKNETAIRFSLPLPPETSMSTMPDAPFPTVSPDGRYIAFVGLGGGSRMLWVHALDAPNAQMLPGTENAHHPFWSPDSRFIGFFASGRLKKVSILGGLPQTLSEGGNDATINGAGATWNQEGVILFGDTASGSGALYRVSASGGTPAVLLEPDKSRAERIGFPHFLPDGRRFLYLAWSPQFAQNAVFLGSLDSNERKQVFTANSRVLYSPPGHLLFAQSGRLMSQPFDERRGEVTGDAFPVVDQTAGYATLGVAAFSVSNNGILAFREGGSGASTQLTWLDRTGKQLGIVSATGSNIAPALSPDSQRLAVTRTEGSGSSDIWLIDLVRETNSRLTFEGGVNAVWSPDGKALVFNSARKGPVSLYQKAASGTGNEDMLFENVPAAMDWSTDGRFILVRRDINGRDIWALPTFGDRKPFAVMETKFNEDLARFSPDGKWIAYASDESGRAEIYVQNFPPAGGKWQVSVGGAGRPRWRRDSKELLFDTPDGKIMAVDVKLGSTFEAGVPRVLFQVPGQIVGPRWAMTPDAQRFLFPFPAGQTGGPPITVIHNWTAIVKK